MGSGQHWHGRKGRGGTDVMELERGDPASKLLQVRKKRHFTDVQLVEGYLCVLNEPGLDLTTSSSELSYLC